MLVVYMSMCEAADLSTTTTRPTTQPTTMTTQPTTQPTTTTTRPTTMTIARKKKTTQPTTTTSSTTTTTQPTTTTSSTTTTTEPTTTTPSTTTTEPTTTTSSTTTTTEPTTTTSSTTTTTEPTTTTSSTTTTQPTTTTSSTTTTQPTTTLTTALPTSTASPMPSIPASRGVSMDVYCNNSWIPVANCVVQVCGTQWLTPGDCVDGESESFRFFGCIDNKVGLRRYGMFGCSGRTVNGNDNVFYIANTCVKMLAYMWGVSVQFHCGTEPT